MSQSVGSAASVGFERPESLSSVDLGALQVIQDEFARQLRPGLSTILSGDISTKVTGIRQDTYAGFQRDLTWPTYVCPVAVSPVQRASVLHLSPELVFPILELMMGGTISPVDPTRQLTAIEEEVLEPIVQIVLRAMSKSWKSVGEIEFSRGADLPLPHETVIVATVEVELSPEARGLVNIALPALLLRRIKARAEVKALPPPAAPTAQQIDTILTLIQPATLEFEARLDGPKVGLRDLLNIKEGQIVLLDQGPDGRVDGLLNKSCYFRGQVVSDGKKRLLLIDSFRESEIA